MAILRGFPPSHTISPGPRIACQCEDCKETKHGVCQYNDRGGFEPIAGSRWLLLCGECAELRRSPSKYKNHWLKNE